MLGRALIEEVEVTDNKRKYMVFDQIEFGSKWTRGSNKVCTVVRKQRDIGKVFLKDEAGKEISIGYWDLQTQYFQVFEYADKG